MAPAEEETAAVKILQFAKDCSINIKGAKIRRTSSRLCLGVEHGDYNGTELFGVGTDRFIWLAYRPNSDKEIKLFSGNFSEDGVIEFRIGEVPDLKSKSIADTWGRFAYGAEYVLRREGFKLSRGIDGVIYGDIAGGGMSRSASLVSNLILSLLDANNIRISDKFKIVEIAQAVENEYIGSPCGQLDPIMILFAREGMGTYYNPMTKSISYVPFGAGAMDFRFVVLDTGTDRPGLEKSTYKIRRAECEKLVSLLQKAGYNINCLADIKDRKVYEQILSRFRCEYPDLCDRLKYIFDAQKRFYEMLDAWRRGNIEKVGSIFRKDGIGLRDDYKISGPELETMCEIARGVPGVFGERMLGGGDKGAAGALVRVDIVEALKSAVDAVYPKKCPKYKDKYSVSVCEMAEGVRIYDNLL
jgi:galactokinase